MLTPRPVPCGAFGVPLALCLLVLGCTPQPPAPSATTPVVVPSAVVPSAVAPSAVASPVQPAAARTRVLVLGTLHGEHLTSKLWGLEQLRATIRRIGPDVVCVELADDNLKAALETWSARKVIEDTRVLRFPEYVQVVFPLMDEMQFTLESGALWHAMLDAMRRGKVADFNKLEQFKEQRAAYEVAKTWSQNWLAAQPQGVADDPYYIHSADFDLHAKARAGAYDYYLNEWIGRPSGWTYVHDEHYEKIMEAVRKHPGETVLVMFGAKDIYWFHEQLRWNPDIDFVDVRPYLPGGDSWQLTASERAVEEFHAGVDCLRVVWAHFRGDTLYAQQRIEEMLALAPAAQAELLAKLQASRGLQLSEFMDGPWLGTPQVVAQGEDWWQIQVEVRHFGDQPLDATWLRARLQKDGNRPGGFVWTELEVPAWLLDTEGKLPR